MGAHPSRPDHGLNSVKSFSDFNLFGCLLLPTHVELIEKLLAEFSEDLGIFAQELLGAFPALPQTDIAVAIP